MFLKGKKLTNVRAAGSDGLVSLTPPVKMSLEEMMAYVNDDELLEVTPQSLRLRKKLLLAHERKRQQKRSRSCLTVSILLLSDPMFSF